MAITFSTEPDVSFPALSTSYAPRWIGQTYVADLDNDGNDDLVIIGASYPMDGAPVAQPSLVAFGKGDGNFAVATEARFPISALTTVHPRELVFADLNGDGFKDIFVGDHGYDANPFPGAQNRLFLSNGNGTWRDATANLPPLADFTHSVSAGDVNGDGSLDLLVGNVPMPNPHNPYVLLNNGQGVFASANLLPTGTGQLLDPASLRFSSSLLADLDGDGRAEMVAGSGFSTTQNPQPARVLWNQQGSFAQGDVTSLPLPAFFGAENSVYDIQAMDLNRDGRPDLVMAYQNSISLGGWELQVLINQGGRVFTDESATYLPEAGSRNGGTPSASSAESQYWVQFIHPEDLNGDGRMDFTLDARGITTAPASFPAAFVQQADGSFDAIRASELAGTHHWLFDYTTQFATWNGGSGFVHVAHYGGETRIELLPTTFQPVEPAWQGFSYAVNRIGTTGDDRLYGGLANDQFTGAAGDDTVSGGEGRDTAHYSGALASYHASAAAGTITVQSTSDGTDVLTQVERLQFGDRSLAFDLDGNAGIVAKVLGAVFGPDTVGNASYAGIGLSLVDGGMTYEAAIQLALQVRLGGPASNADVVALLYQNVVGTVPPAADLSAYTALIDNGTFTQASIGVLAAESSFNANRIDLVGLAAHGLEYA